MRILRKSKKKKSVSTVGILKLEQMLRRNKPCKDGAESKWLRKGNLCGEIDSEKVACRKPEGLFDDER